MIKVDKKVLLRHKTGWVIVYESGGFPSNNYVVFKANVSDSKAKHPTSRVAYCGSLETALNCLYQQLIIEHVSRNKDYCGSLQDLRKAIDDARNDFNELLKPRSQNK